ncbi:hypothetical protein LUZ63_015315 [Rhynchospora breviuscula]|uniref:Cytokinin dehydrogenase 1 FAD/cytokinin binding domain-containing protein n=1 Tax=Rhynchospora breviuscula TaxID=2022672 RepID=A0A9Q0CCE6_9POAL|nr:hypothetical protein LUZ63_015315 [Rhynchospora breviuscula]
MLDFPSPFQTLDSITKRKNKKAEPPKPRCATLLQIGSTGLLRISGRNPPQEAFPTPVLLYPLMTTIINGGAVFYPSSPNDIATLIHFSYTSSKLFPISQRGRGHSTYGQTLDPDGVLIDMSSLGHTNYSRINVIDGLIPYADVGAEQLWIDVLNARLKHDLMPRTGEIVTCSRDCNPDLFYAPLGGLGQFGVITRARIALQPAQKRVRWSRLFYTDIKLVTSDLEKLISPDNNLSGIIDFVEGEVLLGVAQASLIGFTFNFTNSDIPMIIDLASDNN